MTARMDSMFKFRRTRPIVIGGNNPIPTTNDNQSAPLNAGIPYQKALGLPAGTLRNPTNELVLIDEIRITLNRWDTTSAGLIAPPAGTTALLFIPGSMGIELRLGNVFLTRGFVPYALIGNRLGNARLMPTQSWRLPQPLCLAPGAEISARFQSTTSEAPYGLDFTGVANVTLVGRVIEDCTSLPPTIPVPYITWYQGPINAGGTVAFSDESNTTDLANPFDVPLQVQRLTGSILDPNVEYKARTTHELITLQMVDHLAVPTIRNAVEWGAVFGTDRSWAMRSMLPPKGYFLATVNSNIADQSGSAFRAVIGLIGTREVRLA